MAKLTAKKRNALPASKFAGPDRSYPVQDRAHAANAKARATQQVAAGNLSPATAAKIKAKANRVLNNSGKSDNPGDGGAAKQLASSAKRASGVPTPKQMVGKPATKKPGSESARAKKLSGLGTALNPGAGDSEGYAYDFRKGNLNQR